MAVAKLLSYKKACFVYDGTCRFCERFLKTGDRARTSGLQENGNVVATVLPGDTTYVVVPAAITSNVVLRVMLPGVATNSAVWSLPDGSAPNRKMGQLCRNYESENQQFVLSVLSVLSVPFVFIGGRAYLCAPSGHAAWIVSGWAGGGFDCQYKFAKT